MSRGTKAFRCGYADAYHGRPMAVTWGSGGTLGHSYGMGYFHGRAHHGCGFQAPAWVETVTDATHRDYFAVQEKR